MRCVELCPGADLDGFRRALRALIGEGVPPRELAWSTGAAPGLFGDGALKEAPPVALPRAVSELIERVVCHHDPERYALLYELAWRVTRGERSVLEKQHDPLVHRLEQMSKSIRRDLHKMHAFLRFRRIEMPDGTERFAAWFEPEHYIVEATASFFVERFRSLIWSIVTPVGSLHWDRHMLTVGPRGRREDVPAHDTIEAGWIGYYESTFNPARTNPRMMRTEMPKKYWRNMPETQAINALIREAPARLAEMIEREAAMPTKRNPEKAVAAMAEQNPTSLTALNRIIRAAEPLVAGATQAVIGEGPAHAAIVFVGEQPGDQEDIEGRPFVGPAGQLLTRAMTEAGIDRDEAYLTNAVKHFKFEQRGKKRIHQTPTTSEIKHYRWWLMKELDLIRPHLVVALGATAVQALAGKALPIGRNRGETTFGDYRGYITVHPSYLLRIPDAAAKTEAYRDFVADLKRIHKLAGAGAARKTG